MTPVKKGFVWRLSSARTEQLPIFTRTTWIANTESTDIFTKWGTALTMPFTLTKGIQQWRLRLWISATLGIEWQGGEPGQKDLMTVAEKPVLSTNCITKFPRSKPIYLWYEQGHDTGVLHSTEQIKAYPNLQYPAGQKTAVRLPRTLPKMALCHLALSTQMNKISSIETKRAVF